jgi:CHAT domain-containing protein/Flp pilus assembly protein TadD
MSKFSSSLIYLTVIASLGLQLSPVHGQTASTASVVNVPTQTPEALKKAADTAISSKDWLQAIQLWNSYLAQKPDDANGHRRRGYALLELKRFDEAIAAYTKATGFAPKNSAMWNGLCWVQIAANQSLLARPNCQKAVELDSANWAALVNLGHTYLLQGDRSTAQTYYQKTLKNISTESELNSGPLDDFNLFIKNGWQVQESMQAKSWFEKEGAIWLARIAPANKLLDEAKAAVDTKDYALSITLNEARLPMLIELFGETHQRVNEANIALIEALNDYIFALYQKGQSAKAEPIALRALNISEKVNGFDHPSTGSRLNNLAFLYNDMGQFTKAESMYLRALVISEKTNGAEHTETGITLNNLAELYRVMGQYAKAEPMLIRALSISEKVNGAEHRSTGIRLNNLALLYVDMGQYAKAEPMYIRALAISEKVNGAEHPNIGLSLNNLAGFYKELGQYAKAEPMYIRALAISEKAEGAEHPSAAMSLNNLARLYEDMGQNAKAEPMYIRALAISEKVNGAEHPNTGMFLNNLAFWYKDMGQYAKAEPMYIRALAISEKAEGAEHPSTGAKLNNLAGLYRSMGQYAKAEPLYLRAYQIANTAGNPKLSWSVQGSMRELYTQSQPNLAIWVGKQAINTLQTVRASNTALDKETQKSFLENNESTYKSLADLLFAQGRLMEGQQVLAMLKESEYFDFLQRNSATDPRQTQSNFTEQERPWTERYGKISSQLASIGKERELLLKKSKETSATGGLSADDQARKDKLDADMAVARQAYAAFMVELKQEFSKSASAERQQEFGEKNLNSLRALQGTLRDLRHGAVTLHYLMTDKRLWILLTTPTIQLKRESTISEAELNKLIGQYREAIANRSPNIKTLGKALYDILLGPVAEDLKQADAKTLMLSLDGSLRYLPMAALYDGEQYLAKRYSLALYTSAAKDKLKDKPQANWTLAGYGLTQKHEGFNALPAVKGELDGIMEGMKGQVKFDNDFTAKAFKAGLESEPSVVHLASHFVFAPGNETDSYLLLGDGKKLSLKEIKDGYEFVNLDLLTLSACETAVGGGKDANGREVEGFGALAQNQGAKGVIATLWPVADQSTGQFMQLLYGYRQQNPGMTKAQAMQKAQLAFIEGKVEPALAAVSRGAPKITASPAPVTTTDHPYYWAPFILMGNWL